MKWNKMKQYNTKSNKVKYKKKKKTISQKFKYIRNLETF